jgi:hypothetical protein
LQRNRVLLRCFFGYFLCTSKESDSLAKGE